jgi:Tfp pilus assembly protein PilZ
VSLVRLTLPLADKSDWLKVFDPRGGGVFVPTAEPPAVGTEVRVDLTVMEGGPRVILKGSVVWTRPQADGRDPAGCHVGLSNEDREKINFLNGFVRGGLINRREMRRLPLRLPVTYGAIEGPKQTFTRDVNEEGVFVISDKPLPEDTIVHLVIGFPGVPQPLSLKGKVSHTVIVEDGDTPGMGIRFQFADGEGSRMKEVIDQVEAAFIRGLLPEEVIT